VEDNNPRVQRREKRFVHLKLMLSLTTDDSVFTRYT